MLVRGSKTQHSFFSFFPPAILLLRSPFGALLVSCKRDESGPTRRSVGVFHYHREDVHTHPREVGYSVPSEGELRYHTMAEHERALLP